MRSVRYVVEDMVWYDEQYRVACLIGEEVGVRVEGRVWDRVEGRVRDQVWTGVQEWVKEVSDER